MVKQLSKAQKSKKHMNTLHALRWKPMTIHVLGEGMTITKQVFVPHETGAEMRVTSGWRVVRMKPKNKKYRWGIVDPTRKILRNVQSKKPRYFTCPANAIIACEKEARKRWSHAMVSMTRLPGTMAL